MNRTFSQKLVFGFKRLIESIKHEPFDTEFWIPLDSIAIPSNYSDPKDCKIKRCCKWFIKHGYIDEPLTVKRFTNLSDSHDYILTNGYVRYLICKFKGMKNVPVRYDYYES